MVDSPDQDGSPGPRPVEGHSPPRDRPADGGTVASDASQGVDNPVISSDAGALPPPDSGSASAYRDGGPDASSADASVSVVQIETQGDCHPGEIHGDPGAILGSSCLDAGYLASACVVARVRENGGLRVVASEAEMQSSEFAISYTVRGTEILYLCRAAAMPGLTWVCSTPLLGSCANAGDQSTCQPPLWVLSAMPMFTTSCPE